ncbi:MAG: lipoyl(octanoyl) transferase LipB [Myxococcales bacterium]|nr:lipoyl(octanoyl) transferase LipB [Myxococcales bacterium]
MGTLIDLGLCDFHEAWERQLRLVAQRQVGEGEDTLLLVEHPEVITLGRRASSRSNVLSDGIPVIEIERGGDVTWHGPGQLVGYPILRLDGEERDLHRFLRAIEEGLIAVCAALGLEGGRKAGWTGVWLGERKIASIGIAVRRWVTLHGCALNVCNDLARFRAIHPCGLDAGVMTSLAEALGRPITVDEVKPLVADHLGRALGRAFVG